jgi:hypothetical protein
MEKLQVLAEELCAYANQIRDITHETLNPLMIMRLAEQLEIKTQAIHHEAESLNIIAARDAFPEDGE